MMAELLKFPNNFYWGAATAAYQIEGAVDEDGRAESIWDRFSKTPGKVTNGDTGDVACDHYHRWEEDIHLMEELGLNAYRFSISWPRVLPEGRGMANEKGLDFYSRLVDGLLEKGIEPFATLYHWDLPMALQDAGGWLNRRILDWFTEYAELMYKRLGDRVKYWATLNEPNVFAFLGYHLGKHAPGVVDEATFAQVRHHLLLAHGDAVRAGRSLLPKAQFGIVPAIAHNYPATDKPEDVATVESMWKGWTCTFLDPIFRGEYPTIPEGQDYPQPVILEGDMERIAAPIDYLGINHYFSHWIVKGENGYPKWVDKDLPKTDRGWAIYPDGMRDMLLKVTKEYGRIPIYIMENGASYPDKVTADAKVHDTERVNYFRGYIKSLHEAIDLGVDVRGYFAWSLMDNFEWEEGYNSRFGIVYVDFDTQQRIIKDSGRFLSEIFRNNRLELTK
jgi:beta-glucosidase